LGNHFARHMQLTNMISQSLLWRGLYFAALLLVNVLVSRAFQADGAGLLFYISNNLSLLLLLVGFSMESGLGFYASNQQIAPKQLASLAFWWSLVVTAVCGTGLFLYFNIAGLVLPNLGWYSISYIGGLMLTNCFTALFYARKEFRLPNILLSMVLLIMAGILPWQPLTDLASQQKYTNIYFWLFAAQGIVVALAYLVCYRLSVWQIPDWQELKPVVVYSFAALWANLLFFCYYRMDYWFVEYTCKTCDTYALGNYINVSKLGQMCLIIPQILASVVFPATAAGNSETIVPNLQKMTRWLCLFFLLLMLASALLGNWCYPWLFGSSFSQMYWPMLLILPGILSLSMLTLLSAWFAGANQVRVNIIGAAIALAIIAIADWFLIPQYGIKAAAAISTLGYTANLVYALYRMQQQTNCSWLDFFLKIK
jgi:O-antigen/teichoic acid export membrane protein